MTKGMLCSTMKIVEPFAYKRIDKIYQSLRLVGCKAAHRLVEHEEGRVHGERPGDTHKFSFTEGELRDGIARPLFKAHEGEALHGDLAEALFLFSRPGERKAAGEHPRRALRVASHEGVFHHRKAGKKLLELERPPDAFRCDGVGRESGNIFVLKENLPRIRGIDAGDDVDERSFPCPVRADEGVDVSFLQLESDVSERLNAAETFADGVYLKENMMVWRSGHGPSSLRASIARPNPRGLPA